MKRSHLIHRIVLGAALPVVALALCAPAYAAGPGVVSADRISWWHPATNFTAVGKAQAVDTANGRLVVRVWLASLGVQRFLGDDLTVVVPAEAQLLRAHGGKFRAIALADIKLGDHVRVVGVIDRTVPRQPVFRAARVVVRTPVPPESITWFACRGPVKAVDVAEGTIVLHPRLVTRGLWDVLGADTTFAVASDATIVTWRDGVRVKLTLADVVAGDRALAQGSIDRSDPANPVFTIKWMKVWEPVATP